MQVVCGVAMQVYGCGYACGVGVAMHVVWVWLGRYVDGLGRYVDVAMQVCGCGYAGVWVWLC